MTQKEIANTIGTEFTTIVPIIDSFEEQGIVIRKPDHNDHCRNNLIFLTGKSEAKWELIIECALELEKVSLQGFSEEELKLLKGLFAKSLKMLQIFI